MQKDEKENTRISKFLSLVLRHQPQKIGIHLDAEGWTDVHILLQKASAAGVKISLPLLQHIVATNNKKRFSFNPAGTHIRANQGHSVPVELGYQPQTPPPVLYHGTATRFLDAILASGLHKKNRHHVHLSDNRETARQVGQRHGKPVVLTVAAAAMYNQGFTFYLSENGVWLTDRVPAHYLQILADTE